MKLTRTDRGGGVLLEGNKIPSGNRVRNFRSREKGGEHDKDREVESGESEEMVKEHVRSSCGPKESDPG